MGRAKYISHLDLTAVMRRALIRANVELKYSEGFNPHPYISVALPLQVGSGSMCELLDFGIAGTVSALSLPGAINAALPDGIEVLEAYIASQKFNCIEWVGISGRLIYDCGAPQNAALRLKERFASDSIVISKKSKSGVSDINIAPFVKDIVVSGDDVIMFSAVVSAQNPSISPENILNALDGEHIDLSPDFADFTRMELFDSDMQIFR